MRAANNWPALKKQLQENFGLCSILDDEGTQYLLFRHLRNEELGDPADKGARGMLNRLMLAYADTSDLFKGKKLLGHIGWEFHNGSEERKAEMRREMEWVPTAGDERLVSA